MYASLGRLHIESRIQLSKVAGYALDGEDSISAGAKDFSLRHDFQTGQGTQSASYPTIYLHGLGPIYTSGNVSDSKRHASTTSAWRLRHGHALTALFSVHSILSTKDWGVSDAVLRQQKDAPISALLLTGEVKLS